ncbi:MAG TPA: DUF6285 domain-containing protein [Acetobacteraceae bacterium]|nr:DUF6285 domain-containing protein [Acetobacteraceae bacterium]
MRDGPEGAVLLAIARTSLLEEVLPKVPPGQVYAVRMIANAMAIAARELAAADDEAVGRERIVGLYRRAGMAEPEGDIERALAADIRAGRFDAHEAALVDLLEWQVDGRLALANPKARQERKDRG